MGIFYLTPYKRYDCTLNSPQSSQDAIALSYPLPTSRFKSDHFNCLSFMEYCLCHSHTATHDLWQYHGRVCYQFWLIGACILLLSMDFSFIILTILFCANHRQDGRIWPPSSPAELATTKLKAAIEDVHEQLQKKDIRWEEETVRRVGEVRELEKVSLQSCYISIPDICDLQSELRSCFEENKNWIDEGDNCEQRAISDGSRSLDYLLYLDALLLNACAECTPMILCWVATWHPHLQDIKINLKHN